MAPTISTIIARGYVVKENREGVKREYVQLRLEKGSIARKTLSENVGREKNKLSPTDIGMIVTDYLDTQFGDIMDYNFTALVEKEFDEIAEGEKGWVDMIRAFYGRFHTTVDRRWSKSRAERSGPSARDRSGERKAGLREKSAVSARWRRSAETTGKSPAMPV